MRLRVTSRWWVTAQAERRVCWGRCRFAKDPVDCHASRRRHDRVSGGYIPGRDALPCSDRSAVTSVLTALESVLRRAPCPVGGQQNSALRTKSPEWEVRVSRSRNDSRVCRIRYSCIDALVPAFAAVERATDWIRRNTASPELTRASAFHRAKIGPNFQTRCSDGSNSSG